MIYLYIKQHSITKLKYFGKTEKTDPFKYNGSGKYWLRHIKKYGKEYIQTLEIFGFDDQEECTEFALKFSRDNDIVESKEWANLTVENGYQGGDNSYAFTDSTRLAISKANSGKNHPFYGKKRPEHSALMEIKMKGRTLSEKHRKAIGINSSNRFKGVSKSSVHKKNIGNALRDKPKSEEHKKKLSKALRGYKHKREECVFCGEDYGISGMHRHESSCPKNPKNIKPDVITHCIICDSKMINKKAKSCSPRCTTLLGVITKGHRIDPKKIKASPKICKHCGGEYFGANYTRWHGDNCKKNQP